MLIDRVGGTFAPPLSESKLNQYEAMIKALPETSQIRDAMTNLLKCCREWWKLPDSTTNPILHNSGKAVVVKLDDAISKALWDFIPWKTELASYGTLFDSIDAVSQADLRNAAYHLLWHVNELELGREPITTDKL